MISETQIRLAAPSDLSQLVAISEAADSAAHWTHPQWQDIFHSQIPPRLAWIAERPQPAAQRYPSRPISTSAPSSPIAKRPPLEISAVGFLVAQCGSPEWELENMAVRPAFRRRGVGAALLAALLREARARQAERILLEVRASNLSAIRVYGQAGFQPLARRPGYYRNPAEDALIFGHLLSI